MRLTHRVKQKLRLFNLSKQTLPQHTNSADCSICFYLTCHKFIVNTSCHIKHYDLWKCNKWAPKEDETQTHRKRNKFEKKINWLWKHLRGVIIGVCHCLCLGCHKSRLSRTELEPSSLVWKECRDNKGLLLLLLLRWHTPPSWDKPARDMLHQALRSCDTIFYPLHLTSTTRPSSSCHLCKVSWDTCASSEGGLWKHWFTHSSHSIM